MIDIIEDNKMGFLVNAGDDRSIKEKIEWSMLNKRKLKEMGVIARKSAEKKYTSNTIAFQFESYLKKIVHQS
jgi:glycosyltransferase involved in cell wall biosynthesis